MIFAPHPCPFPVRRISAVTVTGTDGTVYVEGTGAYTITTGAYSDTADMSGASAAPVWEDYAVEMPEQIA